MRLAHPEREAKMSIIGRRIYSKNGDLRLEAGDYGRHPGGDWLVCTPNGHVGNVSRHTVTEHEDGTITVSPSILIKHDQGQGWREVFHGFLEQGVWRLAS